MKVFPLLDSDQNLFPPTQQAAILAKYSRSPDTVETLIAGTPEFKSDAFQERVVVNYGHSSVAELATIPVCFEGVSIVASKVLESLPRPGCSEKSTRMVKFHRSQWYDPTEDGSLGEEFANLLQSMFSLYDRVIDWAQTAGFEEREALDIARSILPAGVTTNLGLVAYPRDLAKLQQYLLSSPNPELCNIGRHMQANLQKIGGPLIRHAEAQPWLQNWQPAHGGFLPVQAAAGIGAYLVQFSAAHRFAEEDFYAFAAQVYGMTVDDFIEKMNARPFKAEVPDAFRALRAVFTICIDFGSFRDLQRHRRMNQQVPLFRANYGWVTPKELLNSDLTKEFCALMHDLQGRVHVSSQPSWARQYVIPMAFLHICEFDMDLQQLYYLTELRTQPGGHINYRQVAWQMAQAATKIWPKAMRWCRAVCPDDLE